MAGTVTLGQIAWVLVACAVLVAVFAPLAMYHFFRRSRLSETMPDALDGLTGEERNKVYRMLRLEVTPTPEGYSVTGALRARLHNGMDTLEEIPGIGPETLAKIAPFATI
jgi:hypothetical protein